MTRSRCLFLPFYLIQSRCSKKECPFATNDAPNLQPNIENPSTREGTGVESAEKPNMVVKQCRQNKQVIRIFNLFFFFQIVSFGYEYIDLMLFSLCWKTKQRFLFDLYGLHTVTWHLSCSEQLWKISKSCRDTRLASAASNAL